MKQRNSGTTILRGNDQRDRPILRGRALALLGPVVYAIRLDGGIIKIGFTTNLAAREIDLRSAARSRTSKILGFMPGIYEDEQEIHADLVDHRAHGREYYHPTPEVLAVVNKMRDRFDLPHVTA